MGSNLVEGRDSVHRNLVSRAKRVGAPVIEHTLSYTAPYSIVVHENLEVHHPNGQAKYLEQPARELRYKIPKMIAAWMRQGYTLAQASFFAITALKDASQPLVPVDTGRLKRSWRIRRTK